MEIVITNHAAERGWNRSRLSKKGLRVLYRKSIPMEEEEYRKLDIGPMSSTKIGNIRIERPGRRVVRRHNHHIFIAEVTNSKARVITYINMEEV